MDYTLTPVAGQLRSGAGATGQFRTRADATVTATINYEHKLDSKCSWEVEFTNSGQVRGGKNRKCAYGWRRPDTSTSRHCQAPSN